MTDWYNEDLAYIHDVGYRDYALKSMPGILEILQHDNISTGLIIDLGCGSGLSTEILDRNGYQVLGIDISGAMIEIAKTRVSAAEFRVESLFTAEIPPCAAVISIGECLNYLFDANSDAILDALFHRIYNALPIGGTFIFDAVIPGQVRPGEIVKSFTEGQDWIVLLEKQEDLEQQILTRRIITLRQVGDLYRRTDEVHRQRLFNAQLLSEALGKIGFQVEMRDRYGQFSLPPARVAFIARKPTGIM
ncbi:class I SAM-dependent methyltransferase [Pseudanabaena sp. PCC 6802]|uniref:class I SAM-dependent methyltransferase n=1 Tax=Pseudanabaena sp. PCC 6802 TaxID=118173 RepID=UPI00034DB7B5|nr:methyltransferase domain-containing protein [Pseudanabaena sp. PCC 6802]